jgi:LysM repeat protein
MSTKRMIVITLAVVLSMLLVSAASAAGPLPQEEGQAYTVQAGDWLSKIAEKYYGDVMAYPLIVEATNAKAKEDSSFATITDPDVIEVGQKLWIPVAAGAEEHAGEETAHKPHWSYETRSSSFVARAKANRQLTLCAPMPSPKSCPTSLLTINPPRLRLSTTATPSR